MIALNRLFPAVTLAVGLGLAGLTVAQPVHAEVTAFKQAVAEAASVDAKVAEFYRATDYAPIWTGDSDLHRARRVALVQALRGVSAHGLPVARYNVEALIRQMAQVRTTRDVGLVEVELSRALVGYADDIQSGFLEPSRVNPGMVREVVHRDPVAYLIEFAAANPRAYLSGLAPRSTEYVGLMKERMRLKELIGAGGWGPTVPSSTLKPGESGAAVIALRNRLIEMGYMGRSASRDYDADLQAGVQSFQLTHGLEPDGVAGEGTIAEINVQAEGRLKSVLVALERERWLNRDLGKRHILVNLTDFHARVVDDGRVTFITRSVVGKNTSDRQTPEFSDVMEHMIINPSWHVPRSIATKEYLPRLRNDPNAASHLVITDSRGRRVDRSTVDFSQYSANSFPYAMTQPPSTRNALGLVKFMFPNPHNIYLHDTPEKHLFARESRAFSHGCIRLADPFDFAYTLLAAQTDDPEGQFQSILRTGRETKVDLVQPVPVHLIYRTAQIGDTGQIEYRRDVYGRDAQIWQALEKAGVSLGDVQG